MKKLYFERAKENRGEIPTTFIYDTISDQVKRQIILVWSSTNNLSYWSKEIVLKLRESLGKFQLDKTIRHGTNYIDELNNFFLQTNNIDYSLTVIEEMLIFLNDNGYYSLIDRVNERMRFAGIGYKHDGNFIHRVEDEIFDEEITQKTLGILAKKNYHQTRAHIINAYAELRVGQYDDALTDCCQALETAIKTRLKENKIDYEEKDSINYLLEIFKKQIVAPKFLETYFENLIEVIKGVSIARNKEGGHGKTEGVKSQITKDDDHFVRFVINQTLTNILLITEAKFRK
jgi:HEPN domain-containing protein